MNKTITLSLALVVLCAVVYVVLHNKTAEAPTAPQTAGSGAALDLSNRALTKVPEYVFSRIDLRELDLSENKLTGAIQSQIGALQQLRVLDLSNNHLTGVPAEFGQLRNLEVLNLSHNQITGLPHELGNLSQLRVLDLTGNAYSQADLADIRAHLPASTVIKTD
jgi:uncharacterized protein YjbI with pentapeptide repeats